MNRRWGLPDGSRLSVTVRADDDCDAEARALDEVERYMRGQSLPDFCSGQDVSVRVYTTIVRAKATIGDTEVTCVWDGTREDLMPCERTWSTVMLAMAAALSGGQE